MDVSSRLDRLEEKSDKLLEYVHSIDKTLARNTDSLEEHTRRSNLLEERQESVLALINWVKTSIRLLLGAGAMAAAVVAIMKLIGRI